MEEENTANEELNKKLKQQNLELAENVQFWKVAYSRLETEKIELLRENNDLVSEIVKYKLQLMKFKNIESTIKKNLTRSLTDIVKSSEHIRKIIETFNDQDTDAWETSTTDSPQRAGYPGVPWDNCLSISPKRSGYQGNVLSNNVNHVHPMIRGVTIKKPVIRISRAVLNPVERPVQTSENVPSREIRTENENTPSTSAPRQIETLELCVSLCRVDNLSPNSRTTRINSVHPPENSQQNIGEHNQSPNRTPEQSQASGETVNSNAYLDTQDTSNFLSDGSYEYRSRLECIIEESESENVNWVNSRRKPNPCVVLYRATDDDLNSSLGKSSVNNQSTGLEDDPLEGPSWRMDSQYITRRKHYVSPKKKKKIEDSSDGDESGDDSQVPDSTTNVLKNSLSEDKSLEKSFPSVMEFQSTPVLKSDENTKNTQGPSNKTEKSSTALVAQVKNDCNKDSMDVKVVLSKMKKDVVNIATRKKRLKSKKRGSEPTNEEIAETTPKRDTTSKMSISSNGSSVSFRSSMDNTLTRPRRGDAKNYKEKPLNKKLRRN